MKKYRVNDEWEFEAYDDHSDVFLLVVEQNLPACSYVHKSHTDPDVLQNLYAQLIAQYTDSDVDGLLNVHLVKLPNTQQVCNCICDCDSMEKGSTDEAIAAINNLLNRADCEFLESWRKEPLTEAPKKRKKKPYDFLTMTTGFPAHDMKMFNDFFGTSDLGGAENDGGCESGDWGGSSGDCSESLTEAQGELGKVPGKRYIKRYFIRPQNIFCSKKSDILQALVKDVGDNNCSVYSLKALDDHDDVHLLQPSDIIYYYDDGILYDKNHVKVMDYDLNVKNEEERKKLDIDSVSDSTFDSEYEDRLVEGLEKKCCICGEEFEGHGNNPAPLAAKGVCCNACNLKFVIPARIEAAYSKDETEVED
jgi:hypothetical protein